MKNEISASIIKTNTILDMIANNIKLKRKSLNISQEQLANLTHLDPIYIEQIERSEKNITVLNLEKIANALKVSVVELLNF